MVRVAFLVEKMITLAGFLKLFITMFPCDILFFSLIQLSFSLIFPAFFHEELIITVIFLLILNPFALHLITEYFIMKVLSA
ncbi:hypothetical protein EXW61_11155 [Bacillus mycoides]|nr:hypothetical protein CN600_23350 [Bacillus mycoides]QWG84028.1 hypothetical protein EXW61_11155 [Bacillus mycoides]